MFLTVESLEETLKTQVGDPEIRVVRLAERHQILCRETDEELVCRITARYAPGNSYQVIGF